MNETLAGQATAAAPTDEPQALATVSAALTAVKNAAVAPGAAEVAAPAKEDEPSATTARMGACAFLARWAKPSSPPT